MLDFWLLLDAVFFPEAGGLELLDFFVVAVASLPVLDFLVLLAVVLG